MHRGAEQDPARVRGQGQDRSSVADLGAQRARHRIGKFLLRREIYWEGAGEAWSRKHRSWLTSVRFADQASRATMADYLHAHDVLIARRD